MTCGGNDLGTMSYRSSGSCQCRCMVVNYAVVHQIADTFMSDPQPCTCACATARQRCRCTAVESRHSTFDIRHSTKRINLRFGLFGVLTVLGQPGTARMTGAVRGA